MSPVIIRVALGIVACAGLVHCASESSGGARRAETAALTDVQTSCAGVAEAERQHGPLFDRSRIEGAFDLVEAVPIGKTSWNHVRGAEVVVRSEPGVTRSWLTRVARCHVAMHATAQGPAAATDDPFAVGLPAVSVDEREASFVIAIRGHDDDEGREIARRAHALVAR